MRMQLIVSAAVLAPSIACADLYRFDADPGFFDVVGNWDVWDGTNYVAASELPDGDDRIIIPFDTVCDVRDDGTTAIWTVDTIQIEIDPTDPVQFGRLNINPGATLELENDDVQECPGPLPAPSCPQYDHHNVDGELLLEWNASDEVGILRLKNADQHWFGGDGHVEGLLIAEHDALPEVRIDGNVTVKNLLDEDDQGFRNALRIKTTGAGSSTFINEGLVESDRSALLVIEDNVDVEDIANARWRAVQCGIIQFNGEETDLEGDFILPPGGGGNGDTGVFVFWENVKTCGALIIDSCDANDDLDGDIFVDEAESETFEYAEFITNVGCNNPGTGGAVPPDCEDPFVIASSIDGDTCTTEPPDP